MAEFNTRFQISTPKIRHNSSKLDVFLNKVTKRILGVKKSCNNSIARAHLGWYPITINIHLNAVKYWRRTYDMSSIPFLNAVYSHTNKYPSIWKDGVQNLLSTNGLNDIWRNPCKYDHKTLLRIVRRRMTDIYFQQQQQELDSSKKLTEYNKYCRRTHKQPEYLTQIHDLRHRTTLTKLRTHTHCLQSETGSYIKTVDTNKYNCTNCDLKTPETVMHFILECQWDKIIPSRKKLISILDEDIHEFSHKKSERYMKMILNCDIQERHIQTVYKFLHKMYSMRANQIK